MMNMFTFDNFHFDASSLVLSTTRGEVLELRPKTAELLRVLIAHRDRVVSKRELISCIWHTEHVTDQSVFQAMSELRRRLAPLKPIKTFPNRGYQWVLPVIDSGPKTSTSPWHSWRMTAAAGVTSLGLAIAASVALIVPSTPDVVPLAVPSHSLSLPALVAFSEGAAAMQRGEAEKAVELLELSVTERPEFVEARLLLAEAYLLTGQAQEARQRVDSVMRELTPQTNAYSLIAAMDLLSRTDRELGSMSSALEWAARAADQANSSGYECTAADLHDRVLAMASDPALTAETLKTSPVFASDFARRMLNTALAEREQVESALTNDAGLAQLSGEPSSHAQGSQDAMLLPEWATPSWESSSPPRHTDSEALSPLDDSRVIPPGGGATRPAHCGRFPGGSSTLSVVVTHLENV